MDRRGFLKATGVAGFAAAVPPFLTGCATPPVRPDGSVETVPVDDLMKQGVRTMWIAPHPDDECFPGSLLARSRIHYGNPLHFLILTHGDGGQCCKPEGCHPDLATVRGQEMARVAETYKATLRHDRYWNAPLPVESFPLRHEIFKDRWSKQGDVQGLVTAEIRRFKPDIIFTFHPDWGATGHPEHMLTSRLATTGARLAADPGVEAGDLPAHRTTRLYYMVQQYWLLKAAGRADPGPVTETWDAHAPCTDELNCRDFMCQATRHHETQNDDMSMVRRMRKIFGVLRLRQVDYLTEVQDPAEPQDPSHVI
ncbi:MAG: PIG-L family deacetylase [Deltaproteobacteria bacterium]|nr:PIG-L family deacetylase [Deltaproteobacteria bacterium]